MNKFFRRPTVIRMMHWNMYVNVVILFALCVMLSSCTKYICKDNKMYYKERNVWVESIKYKGQSCHLKNKTLPSEQANIQ